MRALGAVALALAASAAGAQSATVHVPLRHEVVLETGDGTVAWAVDPQVAEASIHAGRVTVVGASAGATTVSVAGAGTVRNYEVVVDPPVRRDAQAAGAGAHEQGATIVEAGYDSRIARATAGLDVLDRSAGRTRRVNLSIVRDEPATRTGNATVAIPSASIEFTGADGSLVLLDRFVQHSPLTVNGVNVRGLHARRGRIRLDAGYASALLYDDLILPADAEGVAGIAVALGHGAFSATPSAFGYRRADGSNEVVGSLLLGAGRDTDPFRLRMEVARAGRWGGAADLAWDAGTSHLRLTARHQPRGFAALAVGPPAGSFADGVWAGSVRRLSLSTTGSLGRYTLGAVTQRSDAASGTLRLGLGAGLYATAGASAGWFDAAGGHVGAASLPGGLAYEGGRFGLSFLYRYQQNTLANRGGSGGRASLRFGAGPLRLSAFADGQRETPTVAFVLGQEPRLARLLAEQGLEARTPDDIARLLEAAAPLAGPGYLRGLGVRLDPWRVQGGADLALALRKDGRQQIRFRGLLDRTRTVKGTRDTLLATASYEMRVAGFDLMAGYTWSSSDFDGVLDEGGSVKVGLRKRFEGAPRLPWSGSDSVEGVVFVDEDATGEYAEGRPPLAGAQVRMDGVRSATTDERGRFRFPGVASGRHALEAVLPASDGAFFTTPSSLVVEAGASATFGVSRTAARLAGHVRDDAGRGIAGVSVSLRGTERSVRAVTDSEGRFAFATADGAYDASIDADSLPEGYESAASEPTPVRLRRTEPTRADFVLRAHRTLSGRVTLPPGCRRAVVRLVQAGRSVETAPDGGYLFRNLRPGAETLVVSAAGLQASRGIMVPEGAVLLQGVDLALVPPR